MYLHMCRFFELKQLLYYDNNNLVITYIVSFYFYLNKRWSRSTVMCALYIHYPSSVSMKSCFAPWPSGTPPSDLAISRTTVKPKSVAAYVDTHLSLLAETVGCKAVQSRANESN